MPYDATWPATYGVVRGRIVDALGDAALAIEHIGSTSVSGLAAKPWVDVDLTVADSADEPSYLPAIEAAGFALVLRQPEWQEHRVLRLPDPAAVLHVWSPGATEPQRHLAFRDWLTAHPDDRAAYADLKVELAAKGFEDSDAYNNAKAALIYDIYERILAADPAHPHDPQPR